MPAVQVPISQECKYFSCSSVRSSIRIFMRRQFQARDFLIDQSGHAIDLLLEIRRMPDHVFGAQGLVGEAHVHDTGRMAFRCRQVDEAALAEHIEAAAIAAG